MHAASPLSPEASSHHTHALGMRAILLGAALAALAGVAPDRAGHRATAAEPLRPAPTPRARLGMNLSGPADWSTELPFVDVFRLSRLWISQREGAAWGKGPELDLDEDGWVRRLEPGCFAETLMLTIDGGHYPGGDYTVTWRGKGRLEAAGAATVASRAAGRMVLRVDPAKGAVFLRLLETDPADPVRDIRVVMPGFEETFREHPFHPTFLDRWRGVACLRFMDWMHTNGSEVARWSDRPTPRSATFTTRGVAAETMVDLANRLDADPWFCIPHLADDDFVRRFAQLVEDLLEPDRKVWVEYSNEVWNGQFAQSRWAGERGRELGFAEKPWEAGWRFTAHRSVEIFRIWEGVFGGTDRLVRVLPTQAANPYVSERVLEFREAWRHADALAIAPYVSLNLPRQGRGLTTSEVAGWSVEQVLDHVESKSLPQAVEWIRRQKEVADRHGLLLVAYEGGQHLVGVGGGENDEKVTALLQAANAHPRMGDIYRRYYEAWTEAGGDLFCHFSSVGRWSKWGSWGILQHQDDDPERSPKYRSTMEWAKSRGQAVRVPGERRAARSGPPEATGKPRQHAALLSVDDRSRIAPVALEDVICFALYTVDDGVLKLSAQLYPLPASASSRVTLEVQRAGRWEEVAAADVHPVGWTATLRVEGWDSTRSVPYRVRHPGGSMYEGLIRRDPVEERTIVAAAFTGNSPGPGGGKISKRDVVDALLRVDPDVLIFTGDQVYNHTQHTAHWIRFGETFGDVIRDRPTITIPDDHDVGQGNLWGGGGREIDVDTRGGYTRPSGYVKLVERQQTSHLPDPVDPASIEQGIGVYFTSLRVGGIDFAIVEDRKFKSGCSGIVRPEQGPRPDHVDKPGYDPAEFDLPGKTLLGERQLRFLRRWGTEWDGVVMKAVVSQTVWSMTSTFHSKNKVFYYADFDSGGWPQSARDRAIDAMRRSFAFHICGDQHLATIVQYGIDEWRDAGWAFCVPSIANLWPRWWLPKSEGLRPEPGAQDHTGDYIDGFGNRVTVYAHTNPRETGREPAELHDRMPGFGIVRFDKKERTITMECWPRMSDPTEPAQAGLQYPGWPRTIRQLDGYGRRPVAWLPRIVVEGADDPVVQVLDGESGEVVYTLRISGREFRPWVFREGTYTVRVGDGADRQVLEGVRSGPESSDARIEVRLGR